MGKITSAAGVKAPWLKLAAVGGELVTDAAPTQLLQGNAKVFSSPFLKHIDPTGNKPSYVMRLVTWQLDDGKWAFGILKEAWENGQLFNGDPALFKLWQHHMVFANQADAQKMVHFYYSNKKMALTERELLGERTYEETQMEGFIEPSKPPIIAGKYWEYEKGKSEATLVEQGQMPFRRSEMTTSKAYTEYQRLTVG